MCKAHPQGKRSAESDSASSLVCFASLQGLLELGALKKSLKLHPVRSPVLLHFASLSLQDSNELREQRYQLHTNDPQFQCQCTLTNPRADPQHTKLLVSEFGKKRNSLNLLTPPSLRDFNSPPPSHYCQFLLFLSPWGSSHTHCHFSSSSPSVSFQQRVHILRDCLRLQHRVCNYDLDAFPSCFQF